MAKHALKILRRENNFGHFFNIKNAGVKMTDSETQNLSIRYHGFLECKMHSSSHATLLMCKLRYFSRGVTGSYSYHVRIPRFGRRGCRPRQDVQRINL